MSLIYCMPVTLAALVITGSRLNGSRLLARYTRADILFLFLKVQREECKHTTSDDGLHEAVVGSPPQQLVKRLRWRHTDVIKFGHHLLLHQRRQHTLNDAFTKFLGHRLQAGHRVEYVTDRLSNTLQNVTNGITQYSTQRTCVLLLFGHFSALHY